MTITRIDPAERMSGAVRYNNTLYYTSVADDLNGDTEAQTASALAAIDAMLARVGSDKSRILDMTLFLADKNDLPAMNRAWDAWLSPGNAPVRCTVQAALMDERYKIEIKVIAAI